MEGIREFGRYDVVVLGSGPAGVAAAIAAARTGARTLIVEQYGFLGGLATTGLPLLSFHTVSRVQICKGIAQQLVDELVAFGGSCGNIFAENDAHVGSMTPIYPEEYKRFLDLTMKRHGVEVLLHAKLVGAVVERGKVVKALLALKEGLAYVAAESFVDATGDADLVAFAKGSFEIGREKDGKTQSMTTLFNIAGVDQETVLKHFPEEVFYGVRPGDDRPSLFHVKGGLGRWREIAGEDYPFKDDDHGLWGMVLRDGQLNLNITDMIDKDALSSRGLTIAEQEGREQIWRIYSFLKKYVPGFEKSFVNFAQVQVGVRETRRIVGLKRLTADDVLSCRHFDDVAVRVGYSIDMHDPDGQGISFKMQQKTDECYDIPFGCLVPASLNGVIVAGRCLSAEHEALASCRVMVFCMGMGEAAGYAAGLSARSGVEIRDLEVPRIQALLRETEAI